MRSIRAAEFVTFFSDCRKKYGFGYEHRVCIHVPEGHTFDDGCDDDFMILKDPAQFAILAASEVEQKMYIASLR